MLDSLVKRNTASAMVETYKTSVVEVKEAFRLLKQAETRLAAAFSADSGFKTWPDRGERHNDVLARLKTCAWRAIFEKIELRKFLSIRNRDDLDNQLYGKTGALPEIEVEAIMSMLSGAVDSLPRYIEEAAKEVFEWLRPRQSRYKTNTEFEIGERVIVRALRPDPFTSSVKIGYCNEQYFRNLDNVFHLLDGKGPIATYGGPILDAFNQRNQISFGQKIVTDYFEVVIFKNGNAHIRFLRMDLLGKLNAMCGGKTLREGV